MLIKFKKIILNNFISFDNAELDLSDLGYVSIEGRNYCKLDNAYSNGSGKSSIFNGICFALTGETAQGISKGIENIFSDPNDCWVELHFIVDNNNFIIRRYRTPKPDMKIWINGEDKSGKGIRESSKLLSEYIPDLTPTLLNSIIILGQGLPSRFTNNTPSQRKEILENLTKSDFMIESIKERLEKRQQELKDSLRSNEDLSLSNRSKLQVYENQLINYNSELDSYHKLFSSEYSIEDQIKIINESIKDVEKNIEEYNNKYKLDNDYIDTLTEENINISKSTVSTKDLDDIICPLQDEFYNRYLFNLWSTYFQYK